MKDRWQKVWTFFRDHIYFLSDRFGFIQPLVESSHSTVFLCLLCYVSLCIGKKNKLRVYYLSWLRNRILHNDPEVEKKQGWITVGELEGCVHYKVGKSTFKFTGPSGMNDYFPKTLFIQLYFLYQWNMKGSSSWWSPWRTQWRYTPGLQSHTTSSWLSRWDTKLLYM